MTAGPFEFVAFDQTAKTVTIARDERWWGDRAKLDQIIYRSLESDALVGAFSNGELDTFDVGPSAPDYARARSTPGAIVRQAAGPDFRHITINGASAPAVRPEGPQGRRDGHQPSGRSPSPTSRASTGRSCC